jgi:hypothetical protein
MAQPATKKLTCSHRFADDLPDRAQFGGKWNVRTARSGKDPVPSRNPVAPRPGAAVAGPATGADVRALVEALRSVLDVVFTPMPDVVARLDTGGRVPVLYLDRDSPPEDHHWALCDVLRFLALGRAATTAAVPAPRLRLIRD